MELRRVDPKTLRFNPHNPRRTKAAPEMDAQLTANIRAIGVIQPPLVRADGDALEIIAGERRVRCSIAAGVTELHVLVSADEDGNDPLRALAENTQRAQMNPVDQWRSIEGLCGSGWGEEAIATAFSMNVRTIRKLRLLAQIHPKMLDRMAFDMPREEDLRKIAAAPLEEQADAWKQNKPKRGETVAWYAIVGALHKDRMAASVAKFDDALANAYGIVWTEDLFAPAGEDSRTTDQCDAFIGAQSEWLANNLPQNGHVAELDQYGSPKLPPKAIRKYGTLQPDDYVACGVSLRTGEIVQIAYTIYDRSDASGYSAAGGFGNVTNAPATRPEVTKKGIERIGDYQTEALHRGLQDAALDDATLIALLVMAFTADNVDVRGEGGSRSACAQIAGSLTEGGVLTSDLAIVRQAGRDMLQQVLTCSQRWNGSGAVARLAGEAIQADRYLPTMADNDFLKCLSKTGIERTAREAGVPVMPQTGKEIRAALLRHIGERHYILPEARFALSDTERAGQAAKAALLTDIFEDGADDEGFDDPSDDEVAFGDDEREAA